MIDIKNTGLDTVSQKESKKRKIFFEGLLVILITSSLILVFLAKAVPYFSFDLYVTKLIQGVNLPFFDLVMRLLTEVGSLSVAIYMVFAAVVFLVLIRRRSDALLIAVSILGTYVISGVLKFLVSRPRPDPLLINQDQVYLVADSFPSGHVMFAIGFFGAVLFLAFSRLKNNYFRIGVSLLCLVIIGLMGVSRIYLGAHWFSDVLGSYLVGYVWLLLLIRMNKFFS